jgi:hypothetical protein
MTMKGGKYLFVHINPVGNDNWLDMVSTVVHESVHVFQKSLVYSGEDSPGDETQAYSIETITKQLLQDYITREGPECLTRKTA